jgi:hypothetical protein
MAVPTNWVLDWVPPTNGFPPSAEPPILMGAASLATT